MEAKDKYVLPSLKHAQKRSQTKSNIEKDLFKIPHEVRNLGINRTFYLRTYGCQANERDGETIAGILEQLHFTQVDTPEAADLIMLNTCAVRKNAEDKVLGELGQLKRLKNTNPDLLFAMCGCMAQEEEIVSLIMKKYPHVDLVFGTHNIHRLPQLLYQAMMNKERTIEVFSKEGEVIENLPVKRFGTHKAWVNIMYGCDKFCTYCIVPYTRGKERSRTVEDILIEVQELKETGFKEITLLGQNVNSYGKDLQIDGGFAHLLKEVAKTGIERIRFTTSHPWDFSDEMVDMIAKYDNIMPFIHLPVQSGDNEMLKIMGRRYTIEDYKATFDKLKNKVKNCAFSTDIIVGFPNESEEQFQRTLDIVDYCQFDNAFTFIYSPREGTPAAKMKDNVSFEVKQDRLNRLMEKTNKYAKMQNDKYVGKVCKVLVDGPSKKNKDIYSGYTEQNKLVNFVRKTDITPGEIVEVKIMEAKTWTLKGEQI
ncbi:MULTISPECIES: tRNA (N6-isopentenyl adenosine(37)-C2)-methylthiotransferase MiaB [unclassified Breznakia]|uniref:tRNA (N6-isopentenyl adenosine(37)-C2)-methylthiotransferase MiaB n=1 Tax=unclassified Breznakia TaxID=2623764 RepID=UPI0024060338|nr:MULTISPECIES: tRNA (N6-isopentenyl adenosine(37)-C2)-methylthiotransferase MiaB [unclassified Breznakia]MDF9837935.1 tRNA-2-methylthio-N6-dimethylallyladenosine synthase [Breznakia sp. PFB2-8]MDF9859924.1 tRNA-2-methylthio-N6-dimethylallyladenosine synthase [Breznakia sp. PH5-24]